MKLNSNVKYIQYDGKNREELIKVFPFLKHTVSGPTDYLHLSGNTYYIRPNEYLFYLKDTGFMFIVSEKAFKRMFKDLTNEEA